MARTQGTSARTQRLITLVAMCLLALTSALAIGRVFLGTASTYEMVVTALASALLACAMERRNLLLATAVSALGMLVAIGIFVFPRTTWFGLPTLDTIEAAIRAAGLIGEQARIQVAPTAPLPPLLLAALTGTWAAIFSAHALAFRAGSPLLALVPPVALVAFADSVLDEFVRPVYGVAFLVAATAVVFADSLRRVQGWGPVWASPGRHARVSATAGRGARRVAFAAVTVAAVSPLLIPGFGSKAILDFSSNSDDQVRIDPLVSVQAQLDRDEPLDVLEVDTPVPTYWRMVALSEFDGSIWKPDPEPFTIDVSQDMTLTPNAAPDPAFLDGVQPVSVSFLTLSDLAVWLPVPYLPVTTNALADGMRWDPEGGSVLLDQPIEESTAYTVNAQLVRPSPDALRAEALPSTADSARYTQLPEDLPPEIADLARAWTAGAETPYDQVIAIQDRFNGVGTEFTYNEDVEPRNDSGALLEFLQQTKEGFCQQFAASMAVMLRSLGIPARVAVGFTAGSFDDETDTIRVTTDDAHAWVEVLFPDYGWLAFEPTPGRQNLTAYPYLDPTSTVCQPSPGQPCRGDAPEGPKGNTGPRNTPAAGPTGETKDAQRPGGLEPDRGPGRGGVDPDITVPDAGRRITVRQVAVALGLVFLLAVAMVPVVRSWRRRRRLRAASSEPRRLILATYDVFTERAGELGLPREAGETVEEYRRRVVSARSSSGQGLDRLSALAADAAYSAREPGRDQAQEATQAADVALQELRKGVGFGQWIGGKYRRS